MVERGGERLHGAGGGVVLRGVAGAVVGASRHVHWAAVQGRDAKVRQALVAGVGVLQQQVGLRRELEGQRWRKVVALHKLLVAVAVRVFHGGIEAKGRRIADAHVQVGRGAAPGVAAHAHRGFARGLAKLRFLGDAVDEAARRSAPIQHGRWAFEDFDALNVGQVAEVQRVVADTVHKLVSNGGEAANHHLVTLAVAMAHGHTGHIAQRVFHRTGALVAQQLGGHHVHGLRHIAQGCAAFGGGRSGRGCVAVALRRGLDGDFAQCLGGAGVGWRALGQGVATGQQQHGGRQGAEGVGQGRRVPHTGHGR